jgi:phosphate transport system substrate-binding protein
VSRLPHTSTDDRGAVSSPGTTILSSSSSAGAQDAAYVLPDGSISIIGNDGWETIMGQFNDLFIKTHPGFKFQMVLKGSSVAIPALETGVSAFAPMGRSMWEGDKTAFREFHNYQPMDIRIGYDGLAPRPGHKNPPGIYVNAKNPLAGLTVEQAARIFTAGSSQGDITHWGQLGLGKAWSNRVIHLYGLRDDGGFATAFRQEFMNKLPFPHNYEPLDRPADVVRAVSEDPYGIGLTGFVDAAAVSNNARLLPMAAHNGDPFVDPTYENVHAGKYPYSFISTST